MYPPTAYADGPACPAIVVSALIAAIAAAWIAIALN